MNFTPLLLCAIAGAPTVVAAQTVQQPVSLTEASTSAPVVGSVDGEVVKVDKRANTVTVRHAGVEHLGVPAGANTWPVRDRLLLDVARPGDRVTFRAERQGGRILIAELAAAVKPSPELIEIQWNAAGQFLQPVAVAPSGFVEVCGKLAKGQAIAWSFSGPMPLAFNIHYHVGSGVFYPAKQEGVASLTGTLVAPVDQDYCWMWENRGAQTAALALSLTRAKGND